MNECTDPVEACGKLILCGEHFVLHGVPAIAVPLPPLKLRLERKEGPETDPVLLRAWNVARSETGLDPAPGFPFEIHSGIPRGVGLGSSAALAVALVRAARVDAGLVSGFEETATMATRVEDVFHGSSSGLDPTAVAAKGPVLRKGDGTVVPLIWRLDGVCLLVAQLPAEGSTAEAVRRSSAFASAHPARFRTMCEEAGGLVDEMSRAISENLPAGRETAGMNLSRYHRMLAELGVSSPSLDAVVRSAEAAGALGAKLTGAGLGGCAVALARDAQADTIEKAWRNAGVKTVFRFDGKDLTVPD